MQIARHWRLKAQRYRLEGSSCPQVGQLTFPHRPVWPHCSHQQDRINGCARSEFAISLDLPVSNRMLDSFSLIRAYWFLVWETVIQESFSHKTSRPNKTTSSCW
jgi:hypothetical protein